MRGAALDRIVDRWSRLPPKEERSAGGRSRPGSHWSGVDFLACDLSRLSLRELGEYWGRLDYAAVAQQIRPTRERADGGKLKIDLHFFEREVSRNLGRVAQMTRWLLV
jgi:hypothetical protein